MTHLLSLALLGLCFAAGLLLPRWRWGAVARRLPGPVRLERWVQAVLWLLLLVMGYRLGSQHGRLQELGQLGALAAATAALAVVGTAVALALAEGALGRLGPAPPPAGGAAGPSATAAALAAPGRLLAMVGVGVVLGLTGWLPVAWDPGFLTGWVLNLLLFLIGLQCAAAGLRPSCAGDAWRWLAVPMATAMGSLAGGALVAPLFGLSAGKTMALAAGFGWYSLSGVLLTDLGDPLLGATAFLANLLREAMALVSIPLLVRGRHPVLAVGVGGATAMDVTLPLLEQCAGPAWVPLSFASGALLSLAVPVLVPLCYHLG
jgi:uncharacterized membrane protein YbjE (DUF340 family)